MIFCHFGKPRRYFVPSANANHHLQLGIISFESDRVCKEFYIVSQFNRTIDNASKAYDNMSAEIWIYFARIQAIG